MQSQKELRQDQQRSRRAGEVVGLGFWFFKERVLRMMGFWVLFLAF